VIATADFNGDGFPDVAVVGIVNGRSGSTWAVRTGRWDRRSLVVASTCANNAVTWIAAGDVNGDSKADLRRHASGASFPGCQNNTVAALQGLGTGKFKKPTYYATGSTTQEQTVLSRGRQRRWQARHRYRKRDSSISVLLNKGNGTYKRRHIEYRTYHDPQSRHLSGLRRLHGDGKMDIAVSAPVNPTSAVYVLPVTAMARSARPSRFQPPYFR